MRALVTGGHGFVGRWLCEHLAAEGDSVVAPTTDEMDVVDPAAVSRVVRDARPAAVYHLAGLAHVGQSWSDPAGYFEVNALGTLHVLEACRAVDPAPRVLVVSSAEVYGSLAPAQMPVAEDAPLLPVSPYAVSKAAAELLAVQAHLGHGVEVVRARPFNHVGPGQAPTFVVAALAARIVEAARTGERALRVGNLSPRRDLTDVRDVVRAYRLLVRHGRAGAAYNVCTGRDIAVEDLVHRMLALAGAELRVEVDPDLVRPVDVPVLRGDPSSLRKETGWEPHIPLEETLRDVLAAAARALEPGRAAGGPAPG